MHFSSFSHSSQSTAFHPNQDIVLEQFYQQRKKRGKNMGKRHSLLQKNASYFANNSQLNDSNSSMCKRQDNKQQNEFHGKPFKQSNLKDNKKAIQPTIKQQINQRKLSISEAQIMKKYAIQGKQNYTTPTTPNSRCLSQSGFKKQKTNFELNASTQSKCNQRKKNLQQLQTNFKILTGQEPERKKIKEVSSKEGVVAANLKQRLKNLVAGGSNEINENADKSRHVEKTEKYQRHIQQQCINDNIKIVNKVRSSSAKSNSKVDHQFFKKDMVSIKQFVANNSFSKKEDEEPLLVLAQETSASAYQKPTKFNNKYEEELYSAYNLHTQQQSKFFKQEEQEQFVASPNFKMSAVIEEEERIRSKINREDDSRVSKGCLKQSKFGLVGSRASYLDNSYHMNQQSNQDWNYSSYNSNTNTSKTDHKQATLINKPDDEKQKMKKRLKQLEQRVEQLQKVNKKQSKFIESVQSMRKAIQKTQAACSLKQLWRWLKVLPNNR